MVMSGRAFRDIRFEFRSLAGPTWSSTSDVRVIVMSSSLFDTFAPGVTLFHRPRKPFAAAASSSCAKPSALV
jgi:hypothetical protein